jgi:hypothetical protein
MQVQIGLHGLRRVKRMGTVETKPLKVHVRPLRTEHYDPESAGVRAAHLEMVQILRKLFEQQPLYMEQMRHVHFIDFQVLASLCSICPRFTVLLQ